MDDRHKFIERLDQEIARLGQQRQSLIELRNLYEPMEEEEELPAIKTRLLTEDMIVQVIENSGRPMTREELREQAQRDFGLLPKDFDVGIELALREASRIVGVGEATIGLAASQSAA